MTSPGRRRSDRVLAPVRIRVIGNNAGGVSFAEETVTVSFNQHGARITLTNSLLPDDMVLIMNLESGIEEEFRVVGAFQEVFGNRQEWGVEALNPESKIWGVDFVPPPEGSQPKVLIECTACQKAAQTPLSSIAYDLLLSTGLILRHCDRCDESTRWKPSEHALTAEVIAPPKPAVMQGQKRKARRVKLLMRLRVRNGWGVSEIAQTRDVSKSGLCFASGHVFNVGEDVYITLPYAEDQAPVETKAKIVWSALGESTRFHGVHYVLTESAGGGR